MLRRHAYLILTVAFFAAMAWPFFTRNLSEWEDVYVRAARHLVAGQNLYPRGESYIYPPFMAVWAAPWVQLAPMPSRALWFGVNVVAFVLMVRWAYQASRDGGSATPGGVSEHIVWFLGLACGLRYAVDGLAHQQTDLLIGALLMGGCLAWTRGHSLLAATALGLAAAAKCTPLLFAIYFLWRGRWLAAVWLVLVAVAANLTADLIHPGPNGQFWVMDWARRYLLPMTGGQSYPGLWGSEPIYNQSLLGAAYRFFVTDYAWTSEGFKVVTAHDAMRPEVYRPLLVLVGGLPLAGFLALLGKPAWPGKQALPAGVERKPAMECGLVLMLMLLLSPMSSKPHFCTLILPGFCLARAAVQQQAHMLRLVLATSILTEFVCTKDLLGGEVSSLVLWWGYVTVQTVLMFLGCAMALGVKPNAVAKTALKLSPGLARASNSNKTRV